MPAEGRKPFPSEMSVNSGSIFKVSCQRVLRRHAWHTTAPWDSANAALVTRQTRPHALRVLLAASALTAPHAHFLPGAASTPCFRH